ncbi:transposase [Streptomyces sp. VRA16 Mangrove soil]|uniref:IS110 family transposase n=1 Tax=Streptomyces sp. VRA16 Mangrove soil TaxID=2817434 RepID=UPI001A9F8A21|nr:transposase [Streptomyces sp. VRA16 Mangrove soil]MBO1331367.1 IS110 family transposase [Streptomyces sp. VRA16 Mangrove soil]
MNFELAPPTGIGPLRIAMSCEGANKAPDTPQDRGERKLSRRVGNDDPELLELIRDVLALADPGEVLWAMDTNHGGAALLIGLAVHRAAAGCLGQSKTAAKDTHGIADQGRTRQDLGLLRPGDEIAIDLRILTGRRVDLVTDRTRQTNRLREQLL